MWSKYQGFLVFSNFLWSVYLRKNLLSNVVCKKNFFNNFFINQSILLQFLIFLTNFQSFFQAFSTNIKQVRGRKLSKLKTFFSHAWFRYKTDTRKLSIFITGGLFDGIFCFEPIKGNFQKFRWSSKIKSVKKVQSWSWYLAILQCLAQFYLSQVQSLISGIKNYIQVSSSFTKWLLTKDLTEKGNIRKILKLSRDI